MNTEPKMYKIKAVIDPSLNVCVSKCMYEIKNIHERIESINHVPSIGTRLDITEQVNKFLKNDQLLPEMESLEARQQQILSQLEQLKSQMVSIRSELKLCAKPGPTLQTKSAKPIDVRNLDKVVIKISPRQLVPNWLLTIQKLWADSLQLIVDVSVHGGVKELPANVRKFNENVQSFRPQPNIPKLHLMLIWKDVPCMELMVSPLKTAIVGEVNALRYLIRIGPSQYNYEESSTINAVSMDCVLDTCARITKETKEWSQLNLIKVLNTQLRNIDTLIGTTFFTIVDLALYSVISQVNSSNSFIVTMMNWYEQCKKSK